jgi:hypothetical protein
MTTGLNRIAITNVATGLVLADTTSEVLNLTEDDLVAEIAKHVASSDPESHRVFRLYRLPMWDGMTEAEYWTLPRDIAGLETAKAELVREVRVP